MLDKSDPRGLYNLLPKFMQECADLINPDDLEDELALELFPDTNGQPPNLWRTLKYAFWDEYDRCQRHENNQLMVEKFCFGIMPRARFRKEVCKTKLLAWLITPPLTYIQRVKEIHELGLASQTEVMKIKINPDKPNVKLIEAQIKIFQFADVRLKGAIVQKIQQQNLNVNVDGNKQSLPAKQLTLDEIQLEIERLQAQSQALLAPARVQLDAQKLITGQYQANQEIIEVDGTQDAGPKEHTITKTVEEINRE
jgi:hypothetical protein